MDNNQDKIEEQVTASISKHCPDPECPMYGLGQPNRTYCIECGTKLTY